MASVAGLGSGLDVDTIVSALMSAEKVAQTRYASQVTTATKQQSAWSDLATRVGALKTTAAALATPALALGTTAASSSTTVRATATAGASPAALDLVVTSLARAEQRASAGLTGPGALVGAGTTVVATGAAALGLTALSGSAAATAGTHVITVSSGTVLVDGVAAELTTDGSRTTATAAGLTLQFDGPLRDGTAAAAVVQTTATTTASDLATQLAAAGSPVSAAVVDTGDGSATPWRTVLSSRTTGTAGALLVSAPSGPLASTTTTASAQDAVLSVNGLQVTRSSNTIGDLSPGLTLSLQSVGASTVTVSPDTASSATSAKALVDGVNALLTQLGAVSSYNATAGTSGVLAGQSGARLLTVALRSATSPTDGTSLSSVGISLTRSGTLQLDQTALSAALARDPSGTASALSALANRVSAVTTSAVSDTGAITRGRAAAGAQITLRQAQVDREADRLTAVEARYRKQYAALDSAMSAATALQTSLKAQLASLTSSS